jgi:predicted AlkP superfamily phosphohydrolase/phosphomutase
MMHDRTLHSEYQGDYIESNIRRDRQWFNILRYFMENEPTDLTAIVFDGVDKLQHLFWRFLDPACMPKKWLPWEKNMQDKVIEYFSRMDAYIDQIVSLAGDEANIFMVSDHGFGPTRYLFHVNVLLEKLGFLGWKDFDEKTKGVNRELSFANIDWEKTSAYAGTPASNGVCIRLPGVPGENRMTRDEYFSFREKLIKKLLDFRDPSTGEQIVTRILTKEKAYSGPAIDRAPDLLLTLSDGSFVSVANEEPIVWNRPDINGTHRPEGIFIAKGPMIKPKKASEPASILDVAPTLFYSLGLQIPKDFEGVVLTEAISDDFLRAHPVSIGESLAGAESFAHAEQPESPYSKDEEKEITDQLRALGYVE